MLAALSPAMKEEVKRFLEPALIDRARGVLTRALGANGFSKVGDGQYQPLYAAQPPQADQEPMVFALEDDTLIAPAADRVVALRRRESKNDNRISSLILAQTWAQAESGGETPTGAADAMRLVVAASKSAPADPGKTSALSYLASWPVGSVSAPTWRPTATCGHGTCRCGDGSGTAIPEAEEPRRTRRGDNRTAQKEGTAAPEGPAGGRRRRDGGRPHGRDPAGRSPRI